MSSVMTGRAILLTVRASLSLTHTENAPVR